MSSRILRPNQSDTKKIGSFTLAYASKSDVVIASHDAPPLPHRPVDPPPESVEVAQVKLTQAEQEAESIVRQAQDNAAQIEKEAYERGFGEGEKAGKEIGEKMAESLLKQYTARLVELNELRKQIFINSEREVVRLSLEIAKKVIKREISIDEEVILTLVKVTLNRLSDQAAVTIRLNPKDYHTMLDQQASKTPLGRGNEGIKLIEDPLISRGGCVIETESGIIDGRIEEQLREIERGFLQ
jgi:flagellar assembly protein FliH